jgi:hypothetical protein
MLKIAGSIFDDGIGRFLFFFPSNLKTPVNQMGGEKICGSSVCLAGQTWASS